MDLVSKGSFIEVIILTLGVTDFTKYINIKKSSLTLKLKLSYLP